MTPSGLDQINPSPENVDPSVLHYILNSIKCMIAIWLWPPFTFYGPLWVLWEPVMMALHNHFLFLSHAGYENTGPSLSTLQRYQCVGPGVHPRPTNLKVFVYAPMQHKSLWGWSAVFIYVCSFLFVCLEKRIMQGENKHISHPSRALHQRSSISDTDSALRKAACLGVSVISPRGWWGGYTHWRSTVSLPVCLCSCYGITDFVPMFFLFF